MRNRRLIATAALAALAVPITGAPAVASSGSSSTTGSVYELAVSAPSDGDDAVIEPQAIPGAAVVAGVRGFTAAKAPQQVSQMLRTGSFLQNFFGGASHLRTNVPDAPLDVIFDR